MGLQVFLHEVTAHRVANQNRGRRQAVDNVGDVIEVVDGRMPVQRFGTGPAAMRAEVDGQRPIPLVGEQVQEVFVPAPCSVPRAVNEQQWHRMRVRATSLVDDFKHLQSPRIKIALGQC